MKKPKLTPADNKFIASFLNLTEKDFDVNKTFIRHNLFNGEKFEVDCIVAAAIDFVFNVQIALESPNSLSRLQQISKELTITNAHRNFDRARMLVLKLNSEAYMGILD